MMGNHQNKKLTVNVENNDGESYLIPAYTIKRERGEQLESCNESHQSSKRFCTSSSSGPESLKKRFLSRLDGDLSSQMGELAPADSNNNNNDNNKEGNNDHDNDEGHPVSRSPSPSSLVKVSPLKSLLRHHQQSQNNNNNHLLQFHSQQQVNNPLVPMNLYASKYGHQCVFCNIVFPDQTLYFLHKGFHSEGNPWKCNICTDQYDNVYEFNAHLLSKPHQ
jgi:hypothetical protein